MDRFRDDLAQTFSDVQGNHKNAKSVHAASKLDGNHATPPKIQTTSLFLGTIQDRSPDGEGAGFGFS